MQKNTCFTTPTTSQHRSQWSVLTPTGWVNRALDPEETRFFKVNSRIPSRVLQLHLILFHNYMNITFTKQICCLHLVDIYGKCSCIYHTWILLVMAFWEFEKPSLLFRWLSIWTPLFRWLSLGLLGGVGVCDFCVEMVVVCDYPSIFVPYLAVVTSQSSMGGFKCGEHHNHNVIMIWNVVFWLADHSSRQTIL